MKTIDKLTSGRTPTTATTSVRSDPEYCWINNNRRLSTDIGKLVVDFILIEEKPYHATDNNNDNSTINADATEIISNTKFLVLIKSYNIH